MLPRNHPDRIQIAYDDYRLEANAGLILPATLKACAFACTNSSGSTSTKEVAPCRANTGDLHDDTGGIKP